MAPSSTTKETTANAGRRQARLTHRQQQARRLQMGALLALCMLPITPEVRTHGVNGKVQADRYHADGTD